MARINSKEKLREYTKSMLGAPLINIEVDNTQIDQIIDDTIQKFTEYSWGDLEGIILLELSGAKEYDLPDTITNILNLTTTSGGSMNFNAQFGDGNVPNIWSEQYFAGTESLTGTAIQSLTSISAKNALFNKYFTKDVYHNFNHLSKKLQVLENYSGVVALHYQYEYLANDDNDLVFNHEWIKAYCVAKTKFLWGTITGKFDQSLVGGARINYADMKSEANEEIQILNELLITKWSDPAPISIA